MSILALVDSSKNALVDPEGHGSSDQGLVSMSLNFLASLLTPLPNELECSPLVSLCSLVQCLEVEEVPIFVEHLSGSWAYPQALD